jgi:hypothetical protein
MLVPLRFRDVRTLFGELLMIPGACQISSSDILVGNWDLNGFWTVVFIALVYGRVVIRLNYLQ